MGRLLKHRKKDDKWRLWSTVSDEWATDWHTEDEIKQEIAAELEYEYKLQVIKAYMTFPNEYYDKDTEKRWYDLKKHDAFYDWQKQIFKGDYCEEIDKKFNELTGNAI